MKQLHSPTNGFTGEILASAGEILSCFACSLQFNLDSGIKSLFASFFYY